MNCGSFCNASDNFMSCSDSVATSSNKAAISVTGVAATDAAQVSGREVDSQGGADSFENTEFSTLRLYLVDHASDLGADFIKNSSSSNAGQLLSIRDGYVNLQLALVLKVGSKLDASVCDLVLFVVPDGRICELNASFSPVCGCSAT
jgi:hypothetical protein